VSQTLYLSEGRRKPKALGRPGPRDVPVLKVTARLPSPAVLYSGETVPLQLFVQRYPSPTDDLHQVGLQSLVVTLQNRTTLMLGNHQTSWTSPSEILRVGGMKVALDDAQSGEQVLEIDALRTMTLPKSIPSFTTCTARRDYVLEVAAGFAFGKAAEMGVSALRPHPSPPSQIPRN
jgi:hypothetical protein